MIAVTELMNAAADRWAGVMWSAVWQSALVAALVLVVTAMLSKKPSSLRFWLWMLVPLRLLVMPVITVSLPILPPAEPIVIAEPVEISALPLVESGDWMPSIDQSITPATAPAPAHRAEEAAFASVRPSAQAWLMAVWLVGVAILGLRTFRGWLRLRLVVRNASETTDPEVLIQARKAATMVGLRRMPRILVTGERTSPFACGVGSPVVVLPASFLESVSRGGLLAVLAHECAHLRRHDSLLGLVLAVCEALYFFHPAVFLAKRRILLERERACDDWVLAATTSKRSAYASALVQAAEIARHMGGPVGPAAIVTESFSDLKARLAAIASGRTPTARLSRKMIAVVIVLGVLAVPGIALTSRRPADFVITGTVKDVATGRVVPGARVSDDGYGPEPHRGAVTDSAGQFRYVTWPEEHFVVAEAQGYAAQRETLSTGVLQAGGNEKTMHFALTALEKEATVHVPVEGAAITVAEAPEPVATPPKPDVETREIRFLTSRSLGGLFVQRKVKQRRYRLGPDYDGVSEWDYLAEARGEVAVPVGKRVKLVVALTALSDLTGLSSLGPNDLYALDVGDYSGTAVYPDASIMPHLSGMTELKELHLQSQHFGDAGLAHLEGLESLEVLRLIAGQVTDTGLEHLAKLRSLRELCLDVSNIRGRGFSRLAELPSLEFLYLSGGDTFGNRGLRYVSDIPSLKSLTLFGEGLKITDAGMPHLAKMTDLEELRFVWIQGITDAGIAQLAPLRSLRLLDLHTTSVTDEGLAHLASLYALEDLVLPLRDITDKGLAHVSRLSKLKRLHTRGTTPVDLTDSGPFTDAGLEHLSSLSDLEELQICSGVGITDAGMAYIARLENLKHLFLMCNGITNDGLATLATVRSLDNLSLSCPNSGALTVAGINHLNALTRLQFLKTNLIRDESTLDLSGLANLENLMILIHDKRGRDRRGALRDEDLAWLTDHPRLKWVQVGKGTEFGDRGMAHLAGLKGLQRLTLGGGLVTDLGLSYVADKHDLTLLHVEGNITDDGLRRLEGLKNLTNLTIKSPHDFSATAEARLREALPNANTIQLDKHVTRGPAAGTR